MVDGFQRGFQRYEQGRGAYEAAQNASQPPAFGPAQQRPQAPPAQGREGRRQRLLDTWAALHGSIAAVKLLGRELAVEAEREIVAADVAFQHDSAVPATAAGLMNTAARRVGGLDGWYKQLGVLAQNDWHPEAFSGAAVVDPCGPVRFGDVLVSSDGKYRRAAPALSRLPWESLVVVNEHPDSETAVGVASGVLCRMLAVAPPGQVRIHVLDPRHAGRSASAFLGLAKVHRPSMTVSTTARDLDEQVQWLVREAGSRTEESLGSVYNNVQDYNAAVRDSPIPYLVVFATDLGADGYGTDTVRQILSLAGSGPRAGVIVLATTDSASATWLGLQKSVRSSVVYVKAGQHTARWVMPAGATRTVEVPVILDDPPPPALCSTVTGLYGERTLATAGSAIPLSRIFPPPERWFGGNSTDKVTLPVGVRGTDVVPIEIGDTSVDAPSHGIIVGATGYGKTTLFHTLLHVAAASYPADELEFWIVDMKEGVEFAAYAPGSDTPTLPNLRVVAMEADREFALAVLDRLNDLISQRAAVFKACTPPTKDIIAYRHQTGEKMPRVVAVIDEFQRCFSHDVGGLTQRAWTACENITKQGRSHGVHLLFASQSLRGLSAASPPQRDSVFAQMLLRVALKSEKFDAQLVLGDKNPAAGTLERRGEAVINHAGGDPAANTKATIAYADSDTFRDLRSRIAAAAPVTLDPFVFRGDMQTPVTDNPSLVAKAGDPSPPGRTWDVWFGQPLAIAPTLTASMWAEPKRNLVVVGGGIGTSEAVAIVSNTVISFAASQPRESPFIIIANLLPAVSDLIEHPDIVAATFGADAFVVTNQDFGDLIVKLAEQIETDDVSRPTLLAVYGGHRSDLQTPDFGTPDELATAFATVLTHGPAQHVTTVAWWEDHTSLSRAVGKIGVEQFGVRVAVNLPESEARTVLEQSAVAPIGDHRAVLWDREDRTRITRFIPHRLPDGETLGRFLGMWK